MNIEIKEQNRKLHTFAFYLHFLLKAFCHPGIDNEQSFFILSDMKSLKIISYVWFKEVRGSIFFLSNRFIISI